MTTYFISLTGNDSNSGSQNSPFATFKKGLETMVSGDTLLVRGGVYTQQISKFSINIPSGTSYANAITVQNFSGESVTLQPNGVCVDFNYIASGSLSYFVFNGINFNGQGSSNEAIYFAGQNIHHVKFLNLRVFNATGQGVHGESGGNFFEFINCEVDHNGHDIQLDHGLYIACPNLIVDSCNIHDNANYGVQIYHGGSGATESNGTIVRNCRVYSNRSGFTINHGDGLDIYNNLIYSNPVKGIDVFYNINNCRVYNNTIYGNGPAIELNDSRVVGTIIRNNIFWQNSIDDILTNGASFTASNNLSSNPNFINQGAADFHLNSNSVAINAGSSLLYSSADIEGNVRSTPPDIGAYEFVTVIVPPPPTTITCDDSLRWVLVSSGSFASNTLLKTIPFTTRPARWICLRSLSEINGNPWTSCTEFMGMVNGVSLLQTNGILLAWEHALITDPVTDTAVAFNIYRRTDPLGPFIFLAQVLYPTVSYLDTSIIPGNTYSYETTAISYSGFESPVSNVVSAVAPNILQHSVWCVDSEELGVNNGAINAIDGSNTTFWHTQYITTTPGQPHNIVIDLGTVYPLNGFTYLPRQDGSVNGTIIQYEFYVCDYFMPKGRGMLAPVMQPMLAM